MEKNQDRVKELIELAARRPSAVTFEGYCTDDQNFTGNLLVVQSPDDILSISKSDILEQEEFGESRVRLWVRIGAQALRISPIALDMASLGFNGRMEYVASPVPVATPGGSLAGDKRTLLSSDVALRGADAMEFRVPPAPVESSHMPGAAEISFEAARTAFVPSLASVSAYWMEACAGGDSYPNNCAHFLSDAFLRAGYSELSPPNPHINARCGTFARRPIRARDMWSWFQSKAVQTSGAVQRDTGWWAVFQLDETVYWGGHVALLDSDSWQFYGTGWYGNWRQYLYKW